jgi:hypothetical protein
MRHTTRLLILSVGLLLLSALIAGCGGDEPDSETLPEASDLLEEAIDNLESASSFEMQVGVSGYPVIIEIEGLGLPEETALAFKYASGVFAAPDSMQASVEFSVGDVTAAAELIAIGREQYLQMNLLTGNRWLNQELIDGFSPSSLLSADTGIPHALQNVSNLTMEGKEDLDGIDVYHLTGKVQATDVNALTFGLINTQTGELDIEIFVLTDGHQVEQVVLREPLPAQVQDEEPTTWTINIMNYNEPVEISTPATEEN